MYYICSVTLDSFESDFDMNYMNDTSYVCVYTYFFLVIVVPKSIVQLYYKHPKYRDRNP